MSPLLFTRRWLGRSPQADASRWVVVDVETSGLDAHNDHLLAIAAVALHLDPTAAPGRPPRIAPGDSFELLLRHEAAEVDKANILLHGIGVGAQRQGVEPARALSAFESWLGSAPLIAFHAAFDQAMIGRAMRQSLGRGLSAAWLDLEPLAAVLHPQVAARSLDDWLAHFAIPCAHRHQAASDVLATAELLLRLWPALLAQGGGADFTALQRQAAQRRWLAAPRGR